MNALTVIANGIEQFNARQKETGRKQLESMEIRMLTHQLEAALAEQMGQLRRELESAASQADVEMARELDWATDIIVAAIRMDNKLTVELDDEKVRQFAERYTLKVSRDEGRTILHLIRNQNESGPSN